MSAGDARVDQCVALIAEALGACLPDRQPLVDAAGEIRRFLDGERGSFMLQVFVAGLGTAAPRVSVSADPRPLPEGCDVAVTLTPLQGGGRVDAPSAQALGVSFQSPRPKLAAYCAMLWAGRRDPTARRDEVLVRAVEEELSRGAQGRFLAAVGSVREELDYWAGSREAGAEPVVRALNVIAGGLAYAEGRPLSEAEVVISTLQGLSEPLGALVATGRYDRRQMDHLCGLVASELARHVASALRRSDYWAARDGRRLLQASDRILGTWEQAAASGPAQEMGCRGLPEGSPLLRLRERIGTILEVM